MTIHDCIHILLPMLTGFIGFWFATVLNRLGNDVRQDHQEPMDFHETRDLFGSRNQGGKP